MELTHLGTLKTVLSEVLLISREQRSIRQELQAGLDRLASFPLPAPPPRHSVGNIPEASRSKRNLTEKQLVNTGAAVGGSSEAEALRVAVDALTQDAAGLHSALRGLRDTVLPARAESDLPHGTVTATPAELPMNASIAAGMTKSAAVYSSMDRTKNPANIGGQAEKSCANTSSDRRDDSEPKPSAAAGENFEHTAAVLKSCRAEAIVTQKISESPETTECAAEVSSGILAIAESGSTGDQFRELGTNASANAVFELASTTTFASTSADVAFASVVLVDWQKGRNPIAGRHSAALMFSQNAVGATNDVENWQGSEPERTALNGLDQLRQRQDLEPLSTESSWRAPQNLFAANSGHRIDFSAITSNSESAIDPLMTAGVDETSRTFKAWSELRQGGRGDNGSVRGRAESSGTISGGSPALTSSHSNQSAEAGWIAALAAAVEDDEAEIPVDDAPDATGARLRIVDA